MRHALPALTRYASASLGNALQVNSTLLQLNLIDNNVNQQHGEFFAGSPCQVQLLQRRFGMNARPSSDVLRKRENANYPPYRSPLTGPSTGFDYWCLIRANASVNPNSLTHECRITGVEWGGPEQTKCSHADMMGAGEISHSHICCSRICR